MDPVSSAAMASFLQASGPWGLAALLLTGGLFLYKRTTTLQDQIVALHGQHSEELKEMLRENVAGLTKSSTATTAAQMLGEENSRTIQKVLDAISPLPPAVQIVSRQVETNAAAISAIVGKVDLVLERTKGDRQ